jgi:hypothetical protein
MIGKLICHFKGHKGLQRSQEYKELYYLLENSGAFCHGVTHIYGGRLYYCSRCGELCICHGVTQWELEDLIEITLQDLPKINWDSLYNWDYDICRIYK